MPRRITQEQFIEKARSFHGECYDYSKTNYVNQKEKVIVTCPKHGDFIIEARRHITLRRGEDKPQGCQKCWKERSRWSKEQLLAEARKYQFRVQFQRESKGAYLSALRKGILDEVCSHMDRQLLPHGYWTFERCKHEALKYESRVSFMRKSGSAYNSSIRNNWLEDICAHMEKGADGYHYMVYAIVNKRLKKAYVGVTKQHFYNRMDGHRQGGSTRANEIVHLPDTEFISVTDYTILSVDLKREEKKWADYYAGIGFQVLNSSKLFGRTGVSRRIYTDEMIADEALKYQTRIQFKLGSPRHYNAACSQRILQKVCAHMRGIKSRNYWTKERCIEAAMDCSDRSEFSTKQYSAYDAARKNGWLEEIWEVTCLRSRNDMPWLRPGARRDVWTRADHFYEIWIHNQKCGESHMRRITALRLDALLKRFSAGWVPVEDKAWIKWRDSIDING